VSKPLFHLEVAMGIMPSAVTILVAAAVLFGGTVNLTPAIVDVSLLALALAGSHLAVGFADGAA
jgi:hypothetical protein